MPRYQPPNLLISTPIFKTKSQEATITDSAESFWAPSSPPNAQINGSIFRANRLQTLVLTLRRMVLSGNHSTERRQPAAVAQQLGFPEGWGGGLEGIRQRKRAVHRRIRKPVRWSETLRRIRDGHFWEFRFEDWWFSVHQILVTGPHSIWGTSLCSWAGLRVTSIEIN